MTHNANLYIGGYYRYREMPRKALTAVRAPNIDFLPPTMYHPIIKVEAPNKKIAMKLIRKELQSTNA